MTDNYKKFLESCFSKIAIFLIVPIFPFCYCNHITKSLGKDSDNENKLHGFAHNFGSLHTMDKLVYWANKEERIYELLRERVALLNKENELISQYMTDYEKSSGKALENLVHPLETAEERGKVIGSSAVLSHIMINRYATTMESLRTLLQSQEYQDMQKKTKDELDTDTSLNKMESFYREIVKGQRQTWPNWEDLYVSNTAILHLQEIYGFLPEQFYKGITIDTNYGGVLRSSHCVKIGMFALSQGYYYMAIEWLEFSLALATLEADQNLVSIQDNIDLIENMLDEAIKMHNEALQWRVGDDFVQIVNTFTTPVHRGQSHNQRVRSRAAHYKIAVDGSGSGAGYKARMEFYRLCSMENQPQETKSTLKCYMQRKSHPYLVLSPFKVEQLSRDPHVVQVYDVLGDETRRGFYEARGQERLSGVASINDYRTTLRQRTSASASILDMEYFKKIQKKSEMITGLIANYDEDPLQGAEYTYGRLYGPHADTMTFREVVHPSTHVVKYGDRLATVLYYVDEAVIGGKTPFCQLGKFANGEPGSAVFWINMYKNGTLRKDVIHGACPVVHGRKAVLNHWIRYNSNFQTFKCSLNQLQ